MLKKNLKLIIILGSILAFIFLAVVIWGKGNSQKESSKISVFETKTDNQGNVTLEVTPEKLGPSEAENIFEVKLNTHSVDLDFDFEKIMVLTDNLGNQYQAVRWEGGRGGHHLEGKIVFPKLKVGVQKVVLKIFALGGAERNFNWRIKSPKM